MYKTYTYMLHTALYNADYYIPTIRVSKSQLHNILQKFCHSHVTITQVKSAHYSLLRVPRFHMGQDSSPWASDGGSKKLWLCQAALKDCPSLSCRLLINFSASVTNEIRSHGWSGSLNSHPENPSPSPTHSAWFSWPGHHLHDCPTSHCHLPIEAAPFTPAWISFESKRESFASQNFDLHQKGPGSLGEKWWKMLLLGSVHAGNFYWHLRAFLIFKALWQDCGINTTLTVLRKFFKGI